MKNNNDGKKGGLLKLIIALIVIGAIAAVVVLGVQGDWFQGRLFGGRITSVSSTTKIANPLMTFEIGTGAVRTNINDIDVSLIGDGYTPVATEKAYINKVTFTCEKHSSTTTNCYDFMNNLYLKVWDDNADTLTTLDGPRVITSDNKVTFDANLWLEPTDNVKLRLYGDISSAGKEGDQFSLDLLSLADVEVGNLDGDLSSRVLLCPSDGDNSSCKYSNNSGYLITIPASLQKVDVPINIQPIKISK